MTFPSDVVKLGSEILYLFLAVVCCFVLFALFVAILYPILAYFFLIEALIDLRKMLIRNKLFDVRFGNCPALRYPDSADLLVTGFTKMQLT